MRISLADIPRLLLTVAVRRMPVERREWGEAMLAELAQLQNKSTRWRFALGCARVDGLRGLKRRSFCAGGGGWQ
jgi:hypothetical protein